MRDQLSVTKKSPKIEPAGRSSRSHSILNNSRGLSNQKNIKRGQRVLATGLRFSLAWSNPWHNRYDWQMPTLRVGKFGYMADRVGTCLLPAIVSLFA